MKNKFVSKWLYRLPVLLLALILAVMPMIMAAPAHADVLSGSSYGFTRLGMTDIYFPNSFNNWVAVVSQLANGSFSFVLYGSNNPLVVDAADGPTYAITGENIFWARIYSDVLNPSVLDFRHLEFKPSVYAAGLDRIAIYVSGDISGSGWDSILGVDKVSFPGVLDTFTGVGSWLSGAVQNISTMFWTAESGMTVLGYLAVASLALAVILLIFYLIAGWLKFH